MLDGLEIARLALRQFADHAVAMDATFLSFLSSFCMILGYALYIRHALVDGLEPNPSTWLMFAYGTALLTALEFDKDAEMHLLFTPIACSALSIWVALICWRRGRLKWPRAWEDRLAFILDILLTIAYVGAWIIATYSIIESFTESDREEAAWWFLILSNLTALTAFAPLVRSSYMHPEGEHAPAWTVWTLSYVTLGIATYQTVGAFGSVLMIYPVLNAFLHAYVALIASRAFNRKPT